MKQLEESTLLLKMCVQQGQASMDASEEALLELGVDLPPATGGDSLDELMEGPSPRAGDTEDGEFHVIATPEP